MIITTIIGSGMVVYSTTAISRVYVKKLSDTVEQLDELIQAFTVWQSKVRYSKPKVLELLREMPFKTDELQRYFGKVIERMQAREGCTISEIAIEEIQGIDVTEPIKKVITNVMNDIGQGDSESNAAILQEAIELLKQLRQKQAEAFTKYAKIYNNLGPLSGILITLLCCGGGKL